MLFMWALGVAIFIPPVLMSGYDATGTVACRLITSMSDTGDVVMARVAEHSGFSNTVTFRKAFKAFRGCLPLEFVRSLSLSGR